MDDGEPSSLGALDTQREMELKTTSRERDRFLFSTSPQQILVKTVADFNYK